MPLTAGQLGGEPVYDEMPWNGDRVCYTYRPDAITMEMIEQSGHLKSVDGQAVPFTVGYLLATLVSWDLLEDDHVTPVALTLERLKRLNAKFLLALVQHTTQESGLGEPNGRTRSGGSGSPSSKGLTPLRPASPHTPRPGTSPSRSQRGSA
ncbi:MAG TPA: hypothetical protein VGR57_10900 [Ktedonobacterales bacterium]|nr:hypothetical protein [Ktedonobacterales bacterium]